MPSVRAPNVLLFITDQQRWDTLGSTGRTPCRTPHLDRLARAGISFYRWLTPDPICSPARAALFTDRYPHATGVVHNHVLPLEGPALPEVFRNAGYEVAYSGMWETVKLRWGGGGQRGPSVVPTAAVAGGARGALERRVRSCTGARGG